jgi:peptidoglycan/LPS O-acetylase OafA/YrhL
VTRDRLGVLDGLRGIAILLVIWYHLWLVSGYVALSGPLQAIVENGFLGVDLFFFVSGFCICYPYARARHERRSRPPLRQFIERRAWKILPSYVLALVAFAILYHARFAGFLDEAWQFAAHLAFVHVWFWPTFGSFSGPLWTLGVEVQFYVLFALLAPQIERRPLVVYAAFVAISIVYRIALTAFGVDNDFGWDNQLPAVLDVFGAGMFGAFAFVQLRGQGGPQPKLAMGCAILALGSIAYGLNAATAAHAGGSDSVLRWLNAWRVTFGPVLILFALGVAFGSPLLRKVVALPALAWLSLVSYNAYLWNLEIAVAIQNAGGPAWVVFWLGGIFTLAVAAALTYGFERPLQRGAFNALLARRRSPPAPPPLGRPVSRIARET